MATPAGDQVIPIGIGGSGFGGSLRTSGGTSLIVLVALMQILGFAIPVVTPTGAVPVIVTGSETTPPAYEFEWTYGGFSLGSPGLLEWAFYLPAMGVAALIAVFLPTRFLRPVLLLAIGTAPWVLLYLRPEIQARLLDRAPLFGWNIDTAIALKGIALFSLAIAGAIIATHAPRGMAIGVGLVAAAPAVVYLGVPVPSRFPGGFAWKQRFEELMSSRPVQTLPGEAAWSEVWGNHILLGAFGVELLALGVGALTCLLVFRYAGSGAGRRIGWCVAAALGTTVVVIVALAMQPLHDVSYEVPRFVSELAFNLKMLMATLSIFLLLPVALIDLIGRTFSWRA